MKKKQTKVVKPTPPPTQKTLDQKPRPSGVRNK